MRLQVDDDIQVAGRTAVHAGLALARQPDAVVLIDAGRNLDRQRLVLLDAPGAAARRARIGNDLAACRGTCGHVCWIEKNPCDTRTSPWPLQVGQCLGLRAGLGAAAVAGLAFLHRRDADLRLGAARGLLERRARGCSAGRRRDRRRCRDRPRCCRRRSRRRCRRTRRRNRRSPRPPRAPARRARRRVDAGVAELVVGGALLRVGQDFVRFLRLLELFLGALVVRIAIRVMLHRELAIGLLDVLFRCVAVEAQHRVVVAFFCHIQLRNRARSGSQTKTRRLNVQ